MLTWLLQLAGRLHAFFRQERFDHDFGQEMEYHLEMLTEDHRRRGMTPQQARRAARLELGGLAQLHETHRDVRGLPLLSAFLQDLRYAFRQLRKAPGFTAAALAALAVGIGATTAIFSLVNAVLLKPLPFADPGRLVLMATTSADESGKGNSNTATSPAKFAHWRAQSDILEDASVFSAGGAVNYTGNDAVEQWPALMVSRYAFRCLGIRILRGHAFTPEEDSPGGPLVAILSESLWKRRFASDPGILGKAISLEGRSYTVAGIAADDPAMLEFGAQADVYLPFQLDPNSRDQGNAGGWFSVARLKPGITLKQAKARLQTSTAAFRSKFPNILERNDSFTVLPVREFLTGDVRPFLLILLGAVSLVLLIACANVASLLLVRAVVRRREIAIRAAIGAGRARIIRQLLTESVLLSLAGGALGLLLGFTAIRALLAVNTAGLPRVGENGIAVSLDWRLMAFTLAVSLITAIVFGLFPAFQASRADLNAVLKNSSGGTGTGFQRNRARAMLVVSEVALAVVLLVGSALLIRSFAALYSVDRGFDPKNVATMHTSLSNPRYSKSASMAQAIHTGLDRIRLLPGVLAASTTCCLPLEDNIDLNFDVIGRPAAALSAGQDAGWAAISPGYFEVFKIPVKQGRTFTFRDDGKSPPVAIINERMAKQYWKDNNALNSRIVIGRGVMKQLEDEPVRQGDVRHQALSADPRPMMYIPQAQLPDAANGLFTHDMAWVVRAQRGSQVPIRTIQEQLRQATGLAVTGVRPMDGVLNLSTGRQRFSMLVMTIFGCAALLLAAMGIYGLMAYIVEQQTHEIGIRLALGAEASQMRNRIVRQGMSLTLLGVAVGVGVAWGLSRFLASLLFGVQARDPIIFTIMPIVLSTTALLAVWLPASRISRIDPSEALRYE